ncbi:MAG: DEAD/DEAH box helicase family protein [Pyrinomonadaceae bacterium]
MEYLDLVNNAGKMLDAAEEQLRRARERAELLAGESMPDYDDANFRAFLKQPYVLSQRKDHEWLCFVPRFVNFEVGWLERTTAAYNIFVINRYTDWLGEIPPDIRAATGMTRPPEDIFVSDGQLIFKPKDKAVAQKFKPFISKWGDGFGRITRGKEFDLLAEMIDAGYMPFKPNPVAKSDLREPELKFNFDGKFSYQYDAYKEFMRRGAVGVYWMTGAGKSFLTMAVMDSIKGEKLLVVPTRTLVDQWRDYFRKYATRLNLSWETRIITYNSYEKVKKDKFSLVVFDECHRLPANTFSKLATVNAKYRIGLSASPKREDGREKYIFALTGFPIGMDWRSLVALLGKHFHTVNVWIVTDEKAKLKKLADLMQGLKTIVFCDSIALGEKASEQLGIPFIHGKTSKRLDIAKTHQAFVASRVMDLGVSIDDLQHIIEIDFLFGSKQQELQRTGRLFHSNDAKQHDILMTADEYDRYGKRLHALVEKGFKVNLLK